MQPPTIIDFPPFDVDDFSLFLSGVFGGDEEEALSHNGSQGKSPQVRKLISTLLSLHQVKAIFRLLASHTHFPPDSEFVEGVLRAEVHI